MTEPRSRKAAMLDRDGTIIPDHPYVNDPANVQLLPGAASAIRALAAAGYPSIVVTNQSGIARGLVSVSQYHAVRQRLDELLAAEGAVLADTFACPHHPDFSGPCSCRKPLAGLYERAAVVHDLDLARCLFIGDKSRDIVPGRSFDARRALVISTNTTPDDIAQANTDAVPVVNSLADAVALLLASS
jgi:histidinol-phosphate phosphatase family protein